MISLGIHGAAGRMGRRLVALSVESEDLELTAAIDRPDAPEQGQDAGTLAGVGPLSVPLTDRLADRVDVLIDFTTPAATRAVLQRCGDLGSALVVGTTGLTDDDHRTIDEAGGRVAVLQAPNMSLGVNLMLALAAQAARRLGDEYDIEIVEAHHRYKADAPSGTALAIAEAVCRATGREPDKVLVHGRVGDDVRRQRGQIGMHALRSGDLAGRHTISFGAIGEQLELTHLATTRDVFAHGALKAARWLAGRPPGRYSIADVLGLDD